jgi:hypothetical protein
VPSIRLPRSVQQAFTSTIFASKDKSISIGATISENQGRSSYNYSSQQLLKTDFQRLHLCRSDDAAEERLS